MKATTPHQISMDLQTTNTSSRWYLATYVGVGIYCDGPQSSLISYASIRQQHAGTLTINHPIIALLHKEFILSGDAAPRSIHFHEVSSQRIHFHAMFYPHKPILIYHQTPNTKWMSLSHDRHFIIGCYMLCLPGPRSPLPPVRPPGLGPGRAHDLRLRPDLPGGPGAQALLLPVRGQGWLRQHQLCPHRGSGCPGQTYKSNIIEISSLRSSKWVGHCYHCIDTKQKLLDLIEPEHFSDNIWVYWFIFRVWWRAPMWSPSPMAGSRPPPTLLTISMDTLLTSATRGSRSTRHKSCRLLNCNTGEMLINVNKWTMQISLFYSHSGRKNVMWVKSWGDRFLLSYTNG